MRGFSVSAGTSIRAQRHRHRPDCFIPSHSDLGAAAHDEEGIRKTSHPSVGGKMKFSVVIPLYNKERYILRAISSILNQTHTDFELIVVDDGSIDEGTALVAKVDDSRVKIVRQRNGGEAAARNRGIQEATSPYI